MFIVHKHRNKNNEINNTFLFQSFNKEGRDYWRKLQIPMQGNFIFHSLGFIYNPICSAQEEFLFSCEPETEDSSFIHVRTFSFNIDTQKLEEKYSDENILYDLYWTCPIVL